MKEFIRIFQSGNTDVGEINIIKQFIKKELIEKMGYNQGK